MPECITANVPPLGLVRTLTSSIGPRRELLLIRGLDKSDSSPVGHLGCTVEGQLRCLQGPKLPPEATFEVFQHSENLTAICCLYYDCSAPSADTAHRAELLEALALASRHIGVLPLPCRTP